MKITRRSFVKGSLGTGALLLGGCGDEIIGQTIDAGVGDAGAGDTGVDDPGFDSGGTEDSGTETGDTGFDSNDTETGMDATPDGPCDDPFSAGEFLEKVEFVTEEGDEPVFHRVFNQGHDGRLLTDLSVVEPGVEVIPNEHFFIRTRYPDLLIHDPEDIWDIRIHGLVENEETVALSDLEDLLEDMGVFVLECSGNYSNGHFGLLSAAQWSGIPISRLLERVSIRDEAIGVTVSGFDEHSTMSANGHSTPGAAWFFTFEQLETSGGFLATHLNGEPLPLDHGFPVRLYMPNWYGCSCIKWVNSLQIVGVDEPATTQMNEFARRTHQPTPNNQPPQLAMEYRPATMDQSAMPIRMERWLVNGETLYRVIGIMWGGYRLTGSLSVRFNPDEDWVPIDVCPPQLNNGGWTVWTHAWRPTTTGRHIIRCRIDDPSIPTIRLDRGKYDRFIQIDEI